MTVVKVNVCERTTGEQRARKRKRKSRVTRREVGGADNMGRIWDERMVRNGLSELCVDYVSGSWPRQHPAALLRGPRLNCSYWLQCRECVTRKKQLRQQQRSRGVQCW